MKKQVSLLLLTALTAAVICGCSGGGGGQPESKPVETETSDKAETQVSSEDLRLTGACCF